MTKTNLASAYSANLQVMRVSCQYNRQRLLEARNSIFKPPLEITGSEVVLVQLVTQEENDTKVSVCYESSPILPMHSLSDLLNRFTLCNLNKSVNQSRKMSTLTKILRVCNKNLIDYHFTTHYNGSMLQPPRGKALYRN